jgi:hypothetical protein
MGDHSIYRVIDGTDMPQITALGELKYPVTKASKVLRVDLSEVVQI